MSKSDRNEESGRPIEEVIVEHAIENVAAKIRHDDKYAYEPPKMPDDKAVEMLRHYIGEPRSKREKLAVRSWVVGSSVIVFILGALLLKATLTPREREVVLVQPQLEMATGQDRQMVDASATAIDLASVRRMMMSVVDLSDPKRPSLKVPLYEVESRPSNVQAGLVRLANLDCPGARPVKLQQLDAALARCEVQLEAIPFDDNVKPAVATWYAQRSSGQLQVRTTPWPIYVETPRHREVVESPFTVRGRAYEDGFLQIRVRPKMHSLYYAANVGEGKTSLQIHAGKDVGPIMITEGGHETYELYFLVATDANEFPKTTPLTALPADNPRIDIIGPVDVVIMPKYGPLRTLAATKAEMELAEKMSARFTAPAPVATGPTAVSWKYLCSGLVEANAAKDYQFVIGVVHGTHVWFQSKPWKTDGQFNGKEVGFGVQDEVHAEVFFQLWLIAVRPDAVGRIQDGQAWVASALPEGCIRVADVEVVKRKAAEK